ncbi:MAG: hypothetical protein HOV81_42845 [Kofleriaceae bacterium]|nr:hypothetical protein [Kofleriaceae bacterium]
MSVWTVDDPTPRASRELVEAFVASHAEFRHASEVIPIMRRDDPDEGRIASRDLALDEGMRTTYRLRAKRAANREPTYSPDLPRDLDELSTQFDAARDQPMRSWSITLPSALMYVIFELLDDRRVAGCMKTVDQRLLAGRR